MCSYSNFLGKLDSVPVMQMLYKVLPFHLEYLFAAGTVEDQFRHLSLVVAIWWRCPSWQITALHLRASQLIISPWMHPKVICQSVHYANEMFSAVTVNNHYKKQKHYFLCCQKTSWCLFYSFLFILLYSKAFYSLGKRKAISVSSIVAFFKKSVRADMAELHELFRKSVFWIFFVHSELCDLANLVIMDSHLNGRLLGAIKN